MQPPSEPVPALVTVHVWQDVAPTRALARLARDRGAVRRVPGLRFAKLLGTGDGRTFGVRDADPRTWALLATWADPDDAARFEEHPVARGWDALAGARWRAELAPLTSTGRWSSRAPFGSPTPRRTPGGVVAITRARLRAGRAPRFWAAVPPVAAALHDSPGLLAALGVGEAPVGLQGTLSVWADDRSLRAFAHEGAAHRAVVARTPEEGWYAEELFARLALLRAEGTLLGRDLTVAG